ncbi:MAG TPA: nucleoside 2-deoxyribosyltransferase domain-containing protein [Patescibacteria group bacterium]|nr:nucleoside 2-deoxyribosyltransferase domain-containing protein [Patescibacteria group bacterium]
MIEIKAPEDYAAHLGRKSIFLAGSIEMGKAEDWQAKVASGLKDIDCLILNPRRENWDASWEQSIDNPMFKQQVDWELDAIDASDMVFMYFVPNTKSPITLLELGLQAGKHADKLVVCCPPGFWRKGNVDIVCRRYGVKQVANIEEFITAAAAYLREK